MKRGTQYVGKQYFTNNEIEALSLDAYCVTNLDLGYTFTARHKRTVWWESVMAIRRKSFLC